MKMNDFFLKVFFGFSMQPIQYGLPNPNGSGYISIKSYCIGKLITKIPSSNLSKFYFQYNTNS
jgi:hypothetical protein